jgi:very-short-patch-repair endonuclease
MLLYNNLHPEAAKKSWTDDKRTQQSIRKKELYQKFPEKHPNRKLANNRSKMSYPELLVYDWLTTRKIEFSHQRKIDVYYVDFCIGKLVIEIDGEAFHDSNYDHNRDLIISSYGFTIKRYPAKSILKYGPSIILNDSISDEIINGYIELRKPRICIKCGCIFYDKRKTCSDECLRAIRLMNPTVNNSVKSQLHLTKSELTELVSVFPMTQIATKFNVSDNAVRKWCMRYGIETKRKFECTKDDLCALIDSGMSKRSISLKIGVSVGRIERMLKYYKLTIDSKCVRYSDKIVSDVLDYIHKGMSNTEISQLMDMNHKQISAIRCKYKHRIIHSISK